MKSIDTILPADETIVYRTKCHYTILFGPMLLILIGSLAVKSQGFHAIALMAFGLLWGVLSYVSFRKSEIGLTRRRVLISAAFPLMKSYDIALDKIAAVDFSQPALGAMLDFGKLAIVHDGQSRCVIRFVSSPAALVTQVRQQITVPSPS